jgi:hypothetical protein
VFQEAAAALVVTRTAVALILLLWGAIGGLQFTSALKKNSVILIHSHKFGYNFSFILVYLVFLFGHL